MTHRTENERGEPSHGMLSVPTGRRSFLKGLGLAAAGASAALTLDSPARADDSARAAGSGVDGLDVFGADPMPLRLQINGRGVDVTVEPRTTLLEALREDLDMTGAKQVCDRGACGCCAVLVDGVAVNSCMMLAADAEGHAITTIEGIAADPAHAPLIDSYCEHDAAQCGFCIPGFVVGSASLLGANHNPGSAEIREALSGHICRCGAHAKIYEAVEAVAKGAAR